MLLTHGDKRVGVDVVVVGVDDGRVVVVRHGMSVGPAEGLAEDNVVEFAVRFLIGE